MKGSTSRSVGFHQKSRKPGRVGVDSPFEHKRNNRLAPHVSCPSPSRNSGPILCCVRYYNFALCATSQSLLFLLEPAKYCRRRASFKHAAHMVHQLSHGPRPLTARLGSVLPTSSRPPAFYFPVSRGSSPRTARNVR